MNRSADPVLPRMPGSAILAVVFLGIQAVLALGSVVFLTCLIPTGFVVALLVDALISASIAIGIVRRRPWARIAGIVVCGAVLTLVAVDLGLAAAAGVPSTSGAGLWFPILLLVFLTRRNTRAWCNDLGPTETPLEPACPEPFARLDRVELLEGIDELGLQANAVGTVIELPATPRTVVVEFDDHPDREPVLVTLHFDEIRLAPVAD
jgi:hypothetical protein